MKRFIKIFLISIGALLGIVVALLMYAQFSYQVSYEAPLIGVKAVTDSSVIARGKYLVHGPAHCADCHAKKDRDDGFPELTGGKDFKTPFGVHYSANLTPDIETGIGAITDEQVARAIRYNINHKDYAMPAYMTFNQMATSDLTAIVSYLRSTAPIKNIVPEHELNIGGKLLMRFVIKPIYHDAVLPETIIPDSTASYGRYLVMAIGNCSGCHTRRNPLGEFEGPLLSGGNPNPTSNGVFTPPNLTPDPTGKIYKWSAKNFIDRFKLGAAIPGTPMPWKSYSNMSDNDLKAIYYYLTSLTPVSNKVDRSFIPVDEKKFSSVHH